MNLHTLNKYIKPTAKAVPSKRVIVTKNELFVSNGTVLLHRKFYYLPRFEREITLANYGDMADEIVDRFYKADVEVELEDVLTPEFDEIIVKVNNYGISFDARKLSAFVQYLLPDFKKNMDFKLKISLENKNYMSIWGNGEFLGCLSCIKTPDAS